LASEGQGILDRRAAGNEELRRQVFARTGNRNPDTAMRGRYWMGPGAAQEAPAPTGMNLEQHRELLEGIRYRDQERASARDRIQAGGGLPTAPRSGLGGLIDRVLPPKRYDIASDPRPAFAEQAARIDAAKSKRQRYLAGEGEYEGRGPAERAAAIAEKRAPVVANAMADRQERNWRMSGGPQQLAFDNALAAQAVARSPMAGAAMFRARAAAQEAALTRDIQREEMQLRRDLMRGDFDERRAARVDSMKMQQAQLGFQRSQLDAQTGLGRDSLTVQREGMDAQREQDQRQHDFAMKQLEDRNRLSPEKRMEAIAAYEAMGYPPDVAERMVDRASGAGDAAGTERDGGATPPRPKRMYKPGDPIPDDLLLSSRDALASGDPSEFARRAQGMGYSKPYVDSMWRTLTHNPKSSISQPTGPTLGDALGQEMLLGMFTRSGRQKWKNWWTNPGNKYE